MYQKSSTGGWNISKNNMIYVYGNVDGKRHRYSIDKKATKDNVRWIEKNYRQVLLHIIDEKKQKRDDEKPSFDLKKFAYQVLEFSAHRRDLEQQRDYKSIVDQKIVPFFRKFGLADIKPFDLECWQNNLLKTYSSCYVKRISGIFSLILGKAVAYELISRNPFDHVEAVKVTYKEEVPYTLYEMKLIMTKSTGWLRLFVNLAFASGLRPGELVALKWSDIDFDQRVIYLQRSITKGKIKETTSTKNHSRIVVLPQVIVAMLKEYKLGSKYEWVFPSTRPREGKIHWYDANGVLKFFQKLVVDIGVPYKKMKTTRHTYISLMRNMGVSSDLIAEIAGHSKEVSDKHYYTPQVSDYKVEAVNNAFEKAGISSAK